MRPFGRFEEEDPEAATLPSTREERDFRLMGEEVDARTAGVGELCRVLGADPLATGEAAALASLCSAAAHGNDSPSCCDCAACCLARAAAAADPGGGGTGILDAAEDNEEPTDGGSGLLREILFRWLAQAPVMERFMLVREASETSSDDSQRQQDPSNAGKEASDVVQVEVRRGKRKTRRVSQKQTSNKKLTVRPLLRICFLFFFFFFSLLVRRIFLIFLGFCFSCCRPAWRLR